MIKIFLNIAVYLNIKLSYAQKQFFLTEDFYFILKLKY